MNEGVCVSIFLFVTQNELKSKDGKLTTSEKDTKQLATEFVKPELDPDILAKRSFAKTLTQGNAVNKFYLFHLVEDKLKEINPQLPKMYGIVCAGTTMSYYGMPMIEMSRAFANNAAVGSAEVESDSLIKARGANFPILDTIFDMLIFSKFLFQTSNNST